MHISDMCFRTSGKLYFPYPHYQYYMYAFEINIFSRVCLSSQVNYQNDCKLLSHCRWAEGDCYGIKECESLKIYIHCIANLMCTWANNTC